MSAAETLITFDAERDIAAPGALSLWLVDDLVFEVGQCAVQMIIPRLRRRFELNGSALAFVAAVSSRNELGMACVIDAIDPILPLAEALLDLGILQEMRPQQRSSPVAGPTILELATLKMSQAGRARVSRNGDWGRGLYPRSDGADFILAGPSPPAADLFEVLERRRSRRSVGSRAPSLADLSNLLAYSYRISALAKEGKGEISFRPVASGGATHAIDIALVVRSVGGLEKGLYRYDAIAHGLCRLACTEEDEERLAQSVACSLGTPSGNPSLVLVFLVNLQRVSAKYADSALALAYMDAGCLVQQLYIVAEGLGLAACALGGADVRLVERVVSPTPNHHFVSGFVIW